MSQKESKSQISKTLNLTGKQRTVAEAWVKKIRFKPIKFNNYNKNPQTISKCLIIESQCVHKEEKAKAHKPRKLEKTKPKFLNWKLHRPKWPHIENERSQKKGNLQRNPPKYPEYGPQISLQSKRELEKKNKKCKWRRAEAKIKVKANEKLKEEWFTRSLVAEKSSKLWELIGSSDKP